MGKGVQGKRSSCLISYETPLPFSREKRALRVLINGKPIQNTDKEPFLSDKLIDNVILCS